ncbi:MAG TPA: class I tRNA ligase family protein, partial [Acidimicrobiales bacterium]
KIRAYGEGSDVNVAQTNSARATLNISLSVLQRLLAPFLPFVTEEVWRWWHDDSVHLATWPRVEELGALSLNPGSIYQPVCDALEDIRREKSTAKASQRASVARFVVNAPDEMASALRAGANDLIAAGNVQEFVVNTAAERSVDVTLEVL